MYKPSLSEFRALAEKGNVIPVYKELLADVETPVSAFKKIDDGEYSFLFESVEGGEKWARYSFLGVAPSLIFRVAGPQVIIEKKGRRHAYPHNGDPLGELKKILNEYRPVASGELPRFYGGAVGFFAFELAGYYETLPESREEGFCGEDAVLMISDLVIIFDNEKHTLRIVANSLVNDEDEIEDLYQEALEKIEGVIEKLRGDKRLSEISRRGDKVFVRADTGPAEYREKVTKAKHYIEEGDVIQVVLARRFETDKVANEFDVYRALRLINPSPYMFFLRLNELVMVGASPEVLVRLTDGVVELRPIAGTRKRGGDEKEDRRLVDDLLSDPKERSEHVMLVDLGRNDLAKIAEVGSVQVNELMVVERYSHVMHLVSHIQAHLQKGKDGFEVIKAVLPAGTLSGAPKIRAMEIIKELEPKRRGPYGGAVGYVGFNGNMDLCIAIRTIFFKEGKVYLQAGAGIVADSDPRKELEEVDNKVKGMVAALELAAGGLEL
ncbi:MAG: anthranilate synthase component I [Deltaproteobacteria bacterium]|nr:anthranilate synthase component I [Deltaproteobacteria bacterium]